MHAASIALRSWGTACLCFLAGLSITSPLAEEARLEFDRVEMGMLFRITLYTGRPEEAPRAATAAFDRISQLNKLLSDYDAGSELSRLSGTSGTGAAVPVSAELWSLLCQGATLSEQSGGAFDVTVGPYVRLWRVARQRRALPDAKRLELASQSVGFSRIRFHPASRAVELAAPQMKLDLGGIAKGYALDEALAVLRAHGIDSALVSCAGDMKAGAAPPGRPAWRVALLPLDVPHPPPIQFIHLADRALATSGDTFQRLEIDGVRYSHIVDPRTGLGLTNHTLVTVIAPEGATADSTATALGVLGPRPGIELARTLKDVEARIVFPARDSFAVEETAGFERFYAPPAHEE